MTKSVKTLIGFVLMAIYALAGMVHAGGMPTEIARVPFPVNINHHRVVDDLGALRAEVRRKNVKHEKKVDDFATFKRIASGNEVILFTGEMCKLVDNAQGTASAIGYRLKYVTFSGGTVYYTTVDMTNAAKKYATPTPAIPVTHCSVNHVGRQVVIWYLKYHNSPNPS